MVAMRRKLNKRSGASVPNARQAPLNSSIFEISARMSASVVRVLSVNIPINIPDYTHFNDIYPFKYPFIPI
jgi:hypothetical protein